MTRNKWNTVYHTSAGVTLYGTTEKSHKQILVKRSYKQLPLQQLANHTIPNYIVEGLTNEYLQKLINYNIRIDNLTYTASENMPLNFKGMDIKNIKEVPEITSVQIKKKQNSNEDKVKVWDEIIITPKTNILSVSAYPATLSNLEDYCLTTEDNYFYCKDVSIEVPVIDWNRVSTGNIRKLTLDKAPLSAELISTLKQNNVKLSLIAIKGSITTPELQDMRVDVIHAAEAIFPEGTSLPHGIRALWAENADLRAFSEITVGSMLNIQDAKISEGLKINFAKPGCLIIDGDNLGKIAEVTNLSSLIVHGGKVDDASLKLLAKQKNLTLLFEGVDMTNVQKTYFLRPQVAHIAITDMVDLQGKRPREMAKMPANIAELTFGTARYPGSLPEAYNSLWQTLCPLNLRHNKTREY